MARCKICDYSTSGKQSEFHTATSINEIRRLLTNYNGEPICNICKKEIEDSLKEFEEDANDNCFS